MALKLTILYDNRAQGGYKADWGFACLIEGREAVLFDTGAQPDILAHNMDLAGVSSASIDKVVLSHEHWDHVGGLPHLKDLRDGTAVFVLPGFRQETLAMVPPHATVQQVTQAGEIAPEVFTTGPVGGRLPEQALWLSTPRGVVMIVACGHPGVDALLLGIETGVRVHGIIGGFHGFRGFDVFEDVALVAPCHCTQYRHVIAERFADAFLDVAAGTEVVF